RLGSSDTGAEAPRRLAPKGISSVWPSLGPYTGFRPIGGVVRWLTASSRTCGEADRGCAWRSGAIVARFSEDPDDEPRRSNRTLRDRPPPLAASGAALDHVPGL